MFNREEIELLRKRLPPRYRELIGEKTNLSIPTIARFFSHEKTVRAHNAELIYDAALEILQERQEKLENRKRKMRQLMTNGVQQDLKL